MTPEQINDLLRQQAWLAGQAYHAGAAESSGAMSPTVWLQRQQQLMKDRQTAFLIQQEQQRMSFMLQQQKNFEMQTRAAMQQQPQQLSAAEAAGLHGFMPEGPVQDAMLLQQQQAQAFEAQQEQERQQKLEAEKRAEEFRLEEERRFLKEQEELLVAQEEAERMERETAAENQRLAAELYEVEKRAEALRLAMINKSSASKAGGKGPPSRLFVIPPNWPKEVPLPPIPPPVPVPIQQPMTPPARSRSPRASNLKDQVMKVAATAAPTGENDPKVYLRAQLQAAAAAGKADEGKDESQPEEPAAKRPKDAVVQAKAMPKLATTLPPTPKVSKTSQPPKAPGSPAPAVGV